MLDQMRNDAEQAALRARLASLPAASPYSDGELAEMEARHAAHALWQERLGFERLHPGSPFGQDGLHQMSADWRCLEAHDELQAIDHRLAHVDHHVCPERKHSWPADPMTASRLDERRSVLLELIGGSSRPARPLLALNEIDRHLVLIEDREAYGDDWQRLKDVAEVSAPQLSISVEQQKRTACQQDQVATREVDFAEGDQRRRQGHEPRDARQEG
jgi:hypothetical protein